MSTLKKLFGAGDQQDDQILYGAEPKKTSEDQTSSERIDSDPAVREQRDYGSSSAVPATEQSKAVTTETSPEKSEDGNESKGKGLLSKILPSKKDKESEETTDASQTTDNRAFETAAVGSTAAVATTEKEKSPERSEESKDTKSKGLLSKILPSRKDKESDAPAENTTTTTTTTETRAAEPKIAERRTAEPNTDDSNFGRDATIAGAGVGAVGAGAAAYSYHERDSAPQKSTVTDPNLRRATGDDVSQATYTERSYQLAGGSASDSAAGATSTHDSHLGRDTAIAGGAVGIVGAGAYTASRGNDAVTPDTRAQDIQNPEQVDTASRFAPHVPGEFPTEDGADPHATNRVIAPAPEFTSPIDRDAPTGAAPGTVAGVGAGGAASAAYGMDKDDGFAPVQRGDNYYGQPPASPAISPPATQTEFAKPQEQEHHYGRDAALAGAGAGLVGGGAYAATRPGDQPTTSSTVTDRTRPTDIQQQRYDDQRATAPNVTGPTTTTESSKPIEEEHRYGRDAALVGGTGVAGIAATEAWKDRDQDTGPAPNTIGPHDSDVKNVMDPRVKPDPSIQKKESVTSGPHKTDIANILDPRVKDSSPTDTNVDDEQRTDSGRDGAVIAATTAMASARDEEGSSKDNRVSTDDRGHHHLHKKSEERTGEKKPGFISKLLHRDKNKENDEPSGEGRHFAGASAAQEIEGQQTSGNAAGLPVGDDGLTHLVKEGSHPDDPHMVIAGDGSEVLKEKEEA